MIRIFRSAPFVVPMAFAVLCSENALSFQQVSIVALHSGKCLQIDGNPANGVHVIQSICVPGAANQLWDTARYAYNIPKGLRISMNDKQGNLFVLDGRNQSNSDPTQRTAVLWQFEEEELLQDWNSTQKGVSNGRIEATYNTYSDPDRCLEVDQGSMADGAQVLLNDCSSVPAIMLHQEFALVPAPNPPHEPVICQVFDDGYSSPSATSDAIFISGRPVDQQQGKACIPGSQFGICRKWFGRCFTEITSIPVRFRIFDNGNTNETGLSDAIYVPKAGGKVCIPDGTPSGTCRKWFGEGRTDDGRGVTCKVFDDGSSNASNPSDAIYVPSPIPRAGTACIPDGSGRGTCRRWFGLCTAD